VNDTFGHEAGDAVLKQFAEILRGNTRRCDISGRVGGDEFLMLIAHADQAGVQIVEQRISSFTRRIILRDSGVTWIGMRSLQGS